VPHREEIKEGGEKKMAMVVLTLGRGCSRGQLDGGRWRGGGVLGDVGVHGGVDVPAPGPAPPQAQTTSSPSFVTAVAASGPGRVSGAPVRPRFASPRPCLLHFPPSPLPLRRRTEERGKTPMWVGGWLENAWSWGIGLPAEAAQGQKCLAHGIGRTAEGATWPSALGRRSLCRRGERGTRVFSSPEDSPGARARALARRPGRPGDRPSHQAGRGRAGQRRRSGEEK
jgi:hypothetical protein